MDDYYERLNQAFANWNGGGEPSLEQRVENLEAEIIQKQDILTFDTEPVEDSENPVTSGGLFSQFERYATKAALNEKVDISNFTADQDRQDALEAEDRTALIAQVDGGAKNLLKNALAGTSLTKYAVTATFDANGVGTISGTNNSTTSDSVFLILEQISPPVGRYHASGCPSGGAVGTYRIDYVSSTGSIYRDIGNGVDFDIAENETIRAQFVVYRGRTAPTGTVQPMLCTAADYTISHAFVPYRPSWQEMYDMIKALQSGS